MSRVVPLASRPKTSGAHVRVLQLVLAAVVALAGLFTAAPVLAQSDASRQSRLERLTPENSVLVMVDYLTGFEPALRTMELAAYHNNLTGLSETAVIFRLPTIVIGDEGGPRGVFMPQIARYFADAPRIARTTPSAWREPRFVEAIRKTGRRKIVLSGISIDNCVLLTALDAMKAGYEVHVVVDASGAESELIERVALDRLVQAGVAPHTWVSLGSELLTDWRTPEGAALGQVYARHSNYFRAAARRPGSRRDDPGEQP